MGDIHNTRSSALINPDLRLDSDWQPDGSFRPVNRRSRVGSRDKLQSYPTLVSEIASCESDEHVISKGHKYIGPNSAIEIVVVFLIRPTNAGADRLIVYKFERGQQTPCWEYSFADPGWRSGLHAHASCKILI
jgi:hypothetical protein